MAQLIQKWEDIDYRPKAVSIPFKVGWFISYDGVGGVIPAESASLYGYATKILGVILTDILSSDDDFADPTQVPFQYALGFKFTVPVSAGTPVSTMIGQTFDVDGANPGEIDLSTPGTQLKVTGILSDTLVEVEVDDVELEG